MFFSQEFPRHFFDSEASKLEMIQKWGLVWHVPFIGFLLLGSLFLGITGQARGQPTVYAARSPSDGLAELVRYSADGSIREHLLTGGATNPGDVEVDTDSGVLFWSNGNGRISRSGIDGSEPTPVLTNLSNPRDLALTSSKVYWTNAIGDQILRANRDGSGKEIVLETSADGIAADPTSGLIYYGDGSEIRRSNVDGTGDQTLISGQGSIAGVVLAPSNGKIYWVDSGNSVIKRANVDGSDVQTLVSSGLNGLEDISLEESEGKMYWIEDDDGTINRANLDGTSSEVVTNVSEVNAVLGLGLSPTTGQVLWANWGSDLIKEASATGGEPSVVVYSFPEIQGVVTSSSMDRLYWTARTGSGNLIGASDPPIYRSTIRGNQVTKLGFSAGDLAVDPGGKLYWVNGSGELRRANVDGSGAEDLLTSLDNPTDVALDLQNDKVYWVDQGTEKIQRANLDGSGVEDVLSFTSSSSPFGLSVEPSAGYLYWADFGDSSIRRASLDGSGESVIINELGVDVEIYADGGKIYWTNFNTSALKRANTDGSNKESVRSGVGSASLALDSSQPLPVELASFVGRQAGSHGVQLRWVTVSETGNAGFKVQHRRPDDSSWGRLAFIESKAPGGTTQKKQTYRFEANDLRVGAHKFRVLQLDLDGTTHVHNPVVVRLQAREDFRVRGPSPNPIGDRGTLSFTSKAEENVEITLYNVIGQKVRTVYQNTSPPNESQTVRLDASDLSSGTYFLRIEAGNTMHARRAVVVR
jgi:sugar lactone lactonase YvrE